MLASMISAKQIDIKQSWPIFFALICIWIEVTFFAAS